ncbi:hypothetical protein LINPERPRIM_LOCUS24266, partial [Linum perenne]
MLIGSFKEVQLRPITVSLPLHIEEDIDLYTSSKKRLIVLSSAKYGLQNLSDVVDLLKKLVDA